MNNFLEIAQLAAKESGKILKNDFYNLSTVMAKGKHDVVSETDLKSEEIILSILQSHFPSHSIISEEAGKKTQESEYCWYIDPIDGTSNFITGNAYFAVSIALAFKNDIITAVIYNPVLDELYYAEKGKGSFLNDKSISVSKRNRLAESYIATAYSASENDIQLGIEMQKKLALHSRRLVLNFAPALDLCNIAKGRLDALVDNGSTCEDHAAGSLILTEAGGKVENLNSNDWDVNRTGIIASNGLLHTEVKNTIQNT